MNADDSCRETLHLQPAHCPLRKVRLFLPPRAQPFVSRRQLSLRVMHCVAVAIGIAMALSVTSVVLLAIELIRDREELD
jgi:hypothetical protein